MKGFLLYEGPSELDGQPIVCIVTDPDQSRLNKKTQRVIQTYIMRADIDPLDAIKSGDDASICGDCIHRGAGGARSCYVQVWSAPRNVWLAYKRGKYEKVWIPANRLGGEIVRLGTYGDPAAVPMEVWHDALYFPDSTLGYTHQWRDQRFADLKQWCMASCESEADYVRAKLLGWRTFRVHAPDVSWRSSHEVVCPASAEAGRKTHCADCKACGGHGSRARCDIVIVAHGDKGKVRAFVEKIDGQPGHRAHHEIEGRLTPTDTGVVAPA